MIGTTSRLESGGRIARKLGGHIHAVRRALLPEITREEVA